MAWWGSANRRSRIPVRFTIQSGSNPCESQQVEVADHVVRDVAARPQDLHARQRSGPWLDVAVGRCS